MYSAISVGLATFILTFLFIFCQRQTIYIPAIVKDGYVNMSEIAESLGFDNVYAFSQFFKNETGASPSRYNKEPH